mmetsp:Transcript_92235/g.246610  ORF Transcript_92235/g.246610 Transcript_92235/m.246610 type:complete len:89 (+) Transcript_92235:102-368(+)
MLRRHQANKQMNWACNEKVSRTVSTVKQNLPPASWHCQLESDFRQQQILPRRDSSAGFCTVDSTSSGLRIRPDPTVELLQLVVLVEPV